MTIQSEVWWITLAGIGLIAIAFAYVIAKSGATADPSDAQRSAYEIRRWWFLALVVLGVGVTWGSLHPFPIADQAAPPQGAQVVEAVGSQWYWDLSADQVSAGVPVEFRVTSTDVNHGFAIYGPDGRVVTQTQAMPGFTNRLVHTFAEPGTYRVLCLEYCGLAHHDMMAEIEVVAATGGGQ